jgi:hypothetical protein
MKDIVSPLVVRGVALVVTDVTLDYILAKSYDSVSVTALYHLYHFVIEYNRKYVNG